jgi:hypothetical protein
MTSRGLPGFLRRSRRWNDFDDEEDGNDMGNDVNRDGSDEANSKQQKASFEASFQAESLRFLDPSPLVALSAQEDADTDDSQSVVASYKNNEDEDSSTNHHSGDQSVSTLGDFDPTEGRLGGPPALTPHNSLNPSSRQSSTGNNGSTYRENQFEKTLSNNVVKLSELRKIGWNGIPVRLIKVCLLHFYFCKQWFLSDHVALESAINSHRIEPKHGKFCWVTFQQTHRDGNRH